MSRIITGPVVGGVFGTLAGSATGNIAEPWLRNAAARANMVEPSLFPSPADLISSYVSGFTNTDTLKLFLLGHGINIDQNEYPRGYARVWGEVIRSKQSLLGLDFLNRLYRRGAIEETGWDMWIRRLGFMDNRVVAHLRRLRRDPLSVTLLWQLVNRGIMSVDDAVKDLQEQGVADLDEARNVLSLRYIIPPPTDLIRMMVRDVFDPNVVAQFGYDRLFDDKFKGQAKAWFDAQGIPGDVARKYWQAHWRIPSPEQLYRMLHLLRPQNIPRYDAVVPGVQPVEIKDVLNALYVDDVAPGWAERLAAISYRTPGRIDLRRLWKTRVYGEQDLIAAYRDLGYTPEVAGHLAKMTIKDVRQQKQEAVVRTTKARILKGLNLGVLREADVPPLLKQYGLTDEEIGLFLVTWKTDDAIDRANETVKIVRSQYMDGTLNDQQANQMLLGLGLHFERVNRMLNLWYLNRLHRRKFLSADKALDLRRRGLVSELEAYARLINLGYLPYDAQLLILTTRQDIAKATLKARLAAAQTERQRQALLRQLIRENRAEEERARQLLARSGSATQLIKWLKKGLISRGEVVDRLQGLGYQEADANRYIDAETNGQAGSENGTEAEATAGEGNGPFSEVTGAAPSPN